MPWQRRLRDISPLSRLLPFVNVRYPAVADALGLNHRDLLWRASPQHLLHTEYLLLLCLQQLCPALATTSRSHPRDGECGCCTHRGRGSQAICNAPALQETGKWLKAPPGAMKPPGFSRERGQAGGAQAGEMGGEGRHALQWCPMTKPCHAVASAATGRQCALPVSLLRRGNCSTAPWDTTLLHILLQQRHLRRGWGITKGRKRPSVTQDPPLWKKLPPHLPHAVPGATHTLPGPDPARSPATNHPTTPSPASLPHLTLPPEPPS